MPRGRTIKTKAREAKAVSQATEEGKQAAHRKKPIEETLKEYIEKLIDKMDPIDAALCAALAYQSFMVFGQKKITKYRNIPYTVTEEGAVYTPTNQLVADLLKSGVPSEVIFRDPSLIKEGTVSKTYYDAIPYEETISTPTAALIGPIGYKLATTDNLISGATGCAILAALGIASLPDIGKFTLEGANAIATTIEEWANSIATAIEGFFK